MERRQQGKSVVLWTIGTLLVCSFGLVLVAEVWLADLAMDLRTGGWYQAPGCSSSQGDS
jgi:hypothetical protein